MARDLPREVPKEVRLFTWARPQVSLYCLAQCALYALLGIFFPETQQASVMVIVGHLLLLASRECVACLADQTLARELYSYCWVAVYALVDGALWLVNRRSQLITGLPAEGMIGIFVLAMLQGVYMRAFGLHEWARLAATACSVVLFTALPAPWSEIGQPWEALGLVCAHTVGELKFSLHSPLRGAHRREGLRQRIRARGLLLPSRLAPPPPPPLRTLRWARPPVRIVICVVGWG